MCAKRKCLRVLSLLVISVCWNWFTVFCYALHTANLFWRSHRSCGDIAFSNLWLIFKKPLCHCKISTVSIIYRHSLEEDPPTVCQSTYGGFFFFLPLSFLPFLLKSFFRWLSKFHLDFRRNTLELNQKCLTC